MTLCRRPGTPETTLLTVWTPSALAHATRPLRMACLLAAPAMVSPPYTYLCTLNVSDRKLHLCVSDLAHVSSIKSLEE